MPSQKPRDDVDDPLDEDELDPVAQTVLARVPEFLGPFIESVRAVDDDPGPGLTLSELARFASDLITDIELQKGVLVRLCAALEEVSATVPDAEDLVGGAFLDALSPGELTLLASWLGPAVRGLADEIGPRSAG
ncbi:MAG: hypothetical protein ACYDA2_08155 [Acidimicrobiales bacterium]